MKMNDASIHVKNLCLSRGPKELYRDFSLDVTPGEILALIAPSGKGKTTLLDFIGGIPLQNDVSLSGSVSFSEGIRAAGTQPRISYLFQDGLLVQSATVLQNVEFPLAHLMDRSAAAERALLFLDRVGLAKRASVHPDQLSGGERQRVALARAFAYPSRILLMDEAFQSQDVRIKMQLIALFREMLGDAERTVLFVTHEIREAVTIASRILVLDGTPVRMLLDTPVLKFPEPPSYIDPPDALLKLERQIIGLLAR